MIWAFIIILAVLIYIAYQLSKLNQIKKNELISKVGGEVEQKIAELFPNFYKSSSNDMKIDIRDFLNQDEDELVDYIYTERYKIMNEKINGETDLKKRDEMGKVKKTISLELNKWDDKLSKMTKNGQISAFETNFVLWNFIKEINEQFPKRYFELNDYFNSQFKIFCKK